MYQGPTHPLDKLINDNSLVMLEAMVPFVDYRMKKILIIYIKYREFTTLMNCLNDIQYVTDCGFNCNPSSQEEMLSTLCDIMPGDFSSSLANAKHMMNVMQTMNAFEAMQGANPGGSNNNNYGPPSQNANTNMPSNNSDGTSLYDSILNIINSESEYNHESDRQSEIQPVKSNEAANNHGNNQPKPKQINGAASHRGYENQPGIK